MFIMGQGWVQDRGLKISEGGGGGGVQVGVSL